MAGFPTEHLAEQLAESSERHARAVESLAHKVDENHKEFSLFRADVSREFGAVRKEMAEGFGAVRAEVAGEFGKVRAEMAGLRAEMVEGFGAVRAEIAAIRSDLTNAVSVAKWTIGIMVPIVLALIGTAFWLTWHAAKLDSRVERLESTVAKARPSIEAPARPPLR